MTRRGFLGLLGVAAAASTGAARPPGYRTVPAGFTGGLRSGLTPRQTRVR